MIVFLNGEFVDERAATVSVFDRSFQYGDGLFETIRIVNGKPFRWDQHMERLAVGAAFLGIQLRFHHAPVPLAGRTNQNRKEICRRDARQHVDVPKLAGSETGAPATTVSEELRAAAERLVIENQTPNAVLRLTLSRGVGVRGYSPKGAVHPTFVMSLHPTPASDPTGACRLITSSLRLPVDDPLAHFKTANKLVQVLARSEADTAGADEALVLNNRGEVCEATSANVFWIEGSRLITPPVYAGALAGITRSVVMELGAPQSLIRIEDSGSPARLLEADGVFLTQSSRGLVEVAELDGKPLRRSPFVQELQSAYARLLAQETA